MDAPKLTVKRARALRRTLSLPEVLVWQRLRRNGIGFRFRRQHPVGPYILDFYCVEERLAVEIDGRGHELPEQARHDIERDAWLTTRGIRVLRLGASDVLADMESAIRTIEVTAQTPSVTA